MQGAFVVAAVVGFLAVGSTKAEPQDPAGVVAWTAMTFTPYGALPPLVGLRMVDTAVADDAIPGRVEFRYARWRFEGDAEGFATFGIGGRLGDVGFAGGYTGCGGCDGRVTGDGVYMAGVDFETILKAWTLGTETAPSRLSIGLRPAGGIGFFTDVTKLITLSGTVDLPVAASIPLGKAGQIIPFLSPGVGIGRVADRGESRKGARASLAAGVAFVAANGLGAHLGWRRILVEDVPATLGVGITFSR